MSFIYISYYAVTVIVPAAVPIAELLVIVAERPTIVASIAGCTKPVAATSTVGGAV